VKAHRLQGAQKEPVLFEAIAPAPRRHQLPENSVGIDADAMPQRNVQILEGNGEAVRALNGDQALFVRPRKLSETDTGTIGKQIKRHGNNKRPL